MFKEFEDYVLAAAIFGMVVVGTEIQKKWKEQKEMEAEIPTEWMRYTNEQLEILTRRLTAANASPKARVQAFIVARDYCVKHIEFYETNDVCRAKGVEFCAKAFNDHIDVWK